MKIIKNVFLVLAALLFFAFLLPNKTKLERSLVIAAPVDSVFNQVNNLQNWVVWNPWQNNDTTIKVSYYGPLAGIGATQKWTSNNGNGKITIMESVYASMVIYELQMEGMSPKTTMFNFEAINSNSTNIIFTMEFVAGYNPIMRYMHVIMKWMMKQDFETALANIKQVTEKK
jgi:hypothetical protein